jgi:hypothetical protein
MLSLPAYPNDLQLTLSSSDADRAKTEAAKVLEPAIIEAALAANAIMGMNNVYFRLLHQVGQEKTRRSLPDCG